MTHCLTYFATTASVISTLGYPAYPPPPDEYKRPPYPDPDDQMLNNQDIGYIRQIANISQSALNNVQEALSTFQGGMDYPPPPTMRTMKSTGPVKRMPPGDNGPPRPPPPPMRTNTPPGYYNPYPNEEGPWKKDSNNNAVAIGLGLGIPLAVIAICAIVVVAIWCHRRRRQEQQPLFPLPLPKKNDYEPQLDSPASAVVDPWALHRSALDINYSKKLGSGAFCNVFKGFIIGEAPVAHVHPGVRTAALRDCAVAIKMLPSFADDIARSDFMQEINFMKSLAYHPHLVSMLGYIADKKSPLLLVEYCEKGDLLHMIRQKKDEVMQGPIVYPNGLNIKDLLMFSWQISNGLEYLNSAGCIHRDIAARNVLVDGSNTCKIGDFGLCRLTDTLLYTARGGRLPLKWMAPESLSTYEYSFKSDVWSYGVLLWELFSLGEVPYAEIQSNDLLEQLRAEKRLGQPAFCPAEIYDVMNICWRWNAADRPTFSDICQKLATMLENATANYGYLVPTTRQGRSGQEQCDNV